MRDHPLHDRPFSIHTNPIQQQGTSSHAEHGESGTLGVDEIARIFNTAIVSTRVETARDFSAELYTLIESPAFRAILTAVRQLSRSQGISEREAAEAMVQTFRKVDRVWYDYVFQEGVDRLKNQIGGL